MAQSAERTRREVVVRGMRFCVALDGPETAPVLMLSNSLSSSMSMWDPQMPALTERWRVMRYDQRGHGGTARSPTPVTIDDLADDAIAILDAFDIPTAHFCGVSMGGMTGMSLLRRHRARIGRAILANTAARMGPPALWNQRIGAVRAGGMAAVAEATVERWLTPTFRARDPETVSKVRAMILATNPDGYAACCAAVRDMDQREAIRAVDAPVLVVIGAHDPATTPKAGAVVAANIPHARTLTLDAAHLSNLEQPEAFNAAMTAFLSEPRR